jgi:putative transposase
MHWLQSTFAIRFNRFRKERGHLFQGRYTAILLEDDVILVRVAHYIHLNPVRAHIVALADCATFRWSSLRGGPNTSGRTFYLRKTAGSVPCELAD